MKSQQMMELLLKEIRANQEENRINQEKAEADRRADKEERKKESEDFLAKLEANQEEMKADRKADRVQMQQMMKLLHANQTKADAKLEGLSDRIEQTQMALQTAEMRRDATTKMLKEDLANNYSETCEAIEEAKREFRDRLEAVQTRTERGITPTVSTSTVQPPTFNGSSTWSVFRRQFETVAEHNQWSDKEKSTHLITALKGRAAEVLPCIPTSTTYEDTLQALEDRFGDQHFAAAYRCQLTTRIQNPGESLQDFATAIEMLTSRFSSCWEGRRRNEALRQALELQAVLVAARPREDNSKTFRKYRSPPTQRRDRRQSECWSCGELGHFGNNCPYERRPTMKGAGNTKIGQADTHRNCQETATKTRTGRVPNRRETSNGRWRRANSGVSHACHGL
jgi:hypothetical protein